MLVSRLGALGSREPRLLGSTRTINQVGLLSGTGNCSLASRALLATIATLVHIDSEMNLYRCNSFQLHQISAFSITVKASEQATTCACIHPADARMLLNDSAAAFDVNDPPLQKASTPHP